MQLWPEDPPGNPGNALQTLVSRLRAELRQAGAGDVIESHPAGYRLAVPPGAVDVMACNATTAISAGVGQRVNVTSGCASSVADLRPMPKDYVPSMPGSDETPPGDGSPDGPNDQPESGEPG